MKAAKLAPSNPAVAVLTAYAPEGEDYSGDGADQLLVKPMNVQQLVNQMEALLISHEDKKQRAMALAASAALSGGAHPGDAKPAPAHRK